MAWLMEVLKICLGEQLLIKKLLEKSFNIAKIPKFDGYQRGLV